MFNDFIQKFLKGFTIQKNVISALLYRELNIKLSKTSIGVFGVLLEPLITILIFVSLRFLIKGLLTSPGMNPFVFFGVGIILFTIFSNTGLSAFSLMGSWWLVVLDFLP